MRRKANSGIFAIGTNGQPSAMGNFDRYSKPVLKGAKKKEAIRADKRQAKQETAAFYDAKRKAAAAAKAGKIAVDAVSAGKPATKAVKATTTAAEEKESPVPAKALKGKTADKKAGVAEAGGDSMPLNKFIAHGGICSRREAADLVKQGKVKVNGQVVTDPGHKVLPTDDIKANGKKVVRKKHLVYILLNKPKDYITTTDDDAGRKTVLDIVKSATTERIYPVGRLDRNTTGVLLLTNDGELAQQLTHPKYEVRKIYEVRLDKPVSKADLDKLVQGLTLEDGPIAADAASYADAKDKSVVGIEIHSGRNRIVRRMFEQLGYDVKNLDRVMFANLTKKNVDRGKWRFLTEKEVRLLKYFNKSKR
ncbi:MAG: rRNA pseudouridine synthase [Chitinophagaceae bacterium]|nr:rRNA pseudouridine synthase [Chitinophagaceae bacterium]